MVKLKDVEGLMPKKQHSCSSCDLLDFEISEIKGFNQAIDQIGQREIGIKQNKAYEFFTQHQRKHDCPGFDCSICYECFSAMVEKEASILEFRQEKGK